MKQKLLNNLKVRQEVKLLPAFYQISDLSIMFCLTNSCLLHSNMVLVWLCLVFGLGRGGGVGVCFGLVFLEIQSRSVLALPWSVLVIFHHDKCSLWQLHYRLINPIFLICKGLHLTTQIAFNLDDPAVGDCITTTSRLIVKFILRTENQYSPIISRRGKKPQTQTKQV